MADEAYGKEAYRKALELLARRPHFEREIRRKLTDRGFSSGDCDVTLTRLKDEKLIDDVVAAIGFIESRLRRGAVGQRRLRAELGRKGAAPDAVDEAVRQVMPESEQELAREAARKWQRKGRRDHDALLRHLDRLGFRPHDIVKVAREISGAEGPHDLGT